jgi:ubiquinol-cytochrome c reductase cytochrome b subunit
MSADTTSTSTPSRLGAKAGQAGGELDDRLTGAGFLRNQLNKVFPTHWSFMLGEIALYSFIVLLVSGTYLALFFDPSLAEVEYQGAYAPLQGVDMSRAYATTLDISFEVRGGLFARQVHHWAALLFVAAMFVHMFRTFFTGAFRKPRETNWVLGVLLLLLGVAEGFMGYTLPDDLLSGTGLRIASGVVMSVPVIGTWAHFLLFGGEYPGEIIIPRLYLLHVFLVPVLILALIAVHLGLVWFQKHTQFPGPRRTERNVVGVRILPTFATHGSGFTFIVVGVLAIMSGVFQINPVWNYGPYNPAQISTFAQPDFYIFFLEGSLRLMPPWELYLGQWTIPAGFWPGAFLPGVLFTLLLMYPMIERKLTGDTAHHNLLQRPRDAPVRTSLGMMSLAFFLVLYVSGFNDVVAYFFSISLNAMTWGGRVALLLLPPLAYAVTYRVCLGLQRADRAVLEHGVETGLIKRLPHGEFIEVHQPLGGVDEHGHAVPLEYQGAPVPKRMNKLGYAGSPVPGSLTRPDPPGETAALEAAHHDEGGEEVDTSGREMAGRPQQPRE